METFFKLKTPDEVFSIIDGFSPVGKESVSLEDAFDRVLNVDLTSPEDLPDFFKSTMDGYAVQARNTFGATESLPALLEITGEVSMGEAENIAVKNGQAVKIPTGGMLPAGADGVMMVEYCSLLDERTLEVSRAISPLENTIQPGDDFKKGAVILPAGKHLRPQDLGVLAGLGFLKIPVFRKPEVAILSTGDEMVPVSQTPRPGEVRDINRYTLSALCRNMGAAPVHMGICSDHFEPLRKMVEKALETADSVWISGGSSVGTRDFTLKVFETLPDFELLVHGISISPGKPTIIGRSGTKPVIGLPGHPASALVVAEVFMTRMLRTLSGNMAARRDVHTIKQAILERNIPSSGGREDYVRIRLKKDGEHSKAVPIFGKSGLISTLVEADGLVRIDMNTEGLYEGDEVDVTLFSHRQQKRYPMKRQVYLSMKSLEEAKSIFFRRFGPENKTGISCVKAEESDTRITAEPVFARRSAPSYHSSAMDGIAVKAEQTYGATERLPMTLALEKDAVWVNTGQPLPKPYDAVIMIEDVHVIDDGHVEIRTSAYPWQHVRKVGEDIVATQLLFPQNHAIRPYDIGALISGGVFSVNVRKRPRVAIIPTGSELVHHEDIRGNETLDEGLIVEYNARVLAGLVKESGGIPLVHDIVSDSEKEIEKILHECVDSDADVVIVNAGSSAGSKDFTVHAIGKMGEVLVHGVAMMPGKPTILGIVAGKPVIGNPGYAVSAALSFEQFVKPLLYSLQGVSPPKKPTIEVQPTRDIPSKVGTEEFLRVNIGKVGDRHVATPLARAAGSITTLTRAEGIIRIPALSEGISQGLPTLAELLVEEEDLNNTVVIIGSHDMAIDILGDEVRQSRGHVRISSGNVGSLGGLIAIRKGTCHMAGSHLLDTETGEYNLSYIKRYIPNMDVTVFHLVLRDQGLIVSKTNPKAIKGVQDLARNDVVFVNRQAGSGTRVLFDYKLNLAHIPSDAVKGYNHEEFTHMAVAVDVLSGAADCGMGIHAAAKALDLDFVPVEQEQYDLVVPTPMLHQPKIQDTLNTMQSVNFKKRVAALGGYDPSRSGERFAEVKSG